MRWFLPLSCGFALSAAAFTQTSEQTFENAPGWKWFVPPVSTDISLRSTRGIVVMLEARDDGALLVTLARGAQANREGVDWRPVAFDREGKRYPLRTQTGGGSSDVSLYRYRSDPQVIHANGIQQVGIEVLTPQGQRIVARHAAKRAQAAGIEVLPFPLVGEPFDFTLTSVDGKKVSARQLRGKVVLIDCWATWCTPCMKKMPKLKELYQKLHQDGFEVIGVGFDSDAERAVAAIKSVGATWPQVLVPADRKTRELWWQAAGIRALPREFLIDRNGILRADCQPGALGEQIEELMKHPPAGPLPKRPAP